jgi:hypothetical protein
MKNVQPHADKSRPPASRKHHKESDLSIKTTTPGQSKNFNSGCEAVALSKQPEFNSLTI